MCSIVRRSAAKELLRRMAPSCAAIPWSSAAAWLREAYEHPGYRWEVERYERVERLIHQSRADHRRHTEPAQDR